MKGGEGENIKDVKINLRLYEREGQGGREGEREMRKEREGEREKVRKRER